MSISFKQASIEELQVLINKGWAAKTLMQKGNAFHDFIIPELEDELKTLDASLVWTPGSTEKSVEAIGIDRVWKSGIAHGIGKLWVVLNRMKNDGLEAEKEMGLREKKKAL